LFTASLSRGMIRQIRLWWIPRYTLQPRAHPEQIEAVFFRNQTRCLKRNSLTVSAPTGQMSEVHPE
jgi:hypothetical protein